MTPSLTYVEWIMGDDSNMVEWEANQGGSVGLVVCVAEKQAWSIF